MGLPNTSGRPSPTPPRSVLPEPRSRSKTRDTRAVFGNYISIYDVVQANEDGVTVPIYYEGRHVKLDLAEEEKPVLDEGFEEVTENEEESARERLRSKWAQLEAVIDESTGTTVRRHELHFQFDARRYLEWVAELAVWLEDEGEGEDDSSLPSDNSCNTVATVANGVRPLSGVLDPRTFARVKVELGRCEICDTGKAVYRSREAQTKICEGCYARLVREGNAREGGAVNDGS